MTRSGPPLSAWWAKVAHNRENTVVHHSSDELLQLLWREGFGPVATARMMDWYCSCHPDNIKEAIEKPKIGDTLEAPP